MVHIGPGEPDPRDDMVYDKNALPLDKDVHPINDCD